MYHFNSSENTNSLQVLQKGETPVFNLLFTLQPAHKNFVYTSSTIGCHLRHVTFWCSASNRTMQGHMGIHWFGLMLNVPVNNFSVMLGQSHRFLGITSSFLGVKMSYSRTQHGDLSGTRTRPLDPESEVLTTRPPRPHPPPLYRHTTASDTSIQF